MMDSQRKATKTFRQKLKSAFMLTKNKKDNTGTTAGNKWCTGSDDVTDVRYHQLLLELTEACMRAQPLATNANNNKLRATKSTSSILNTDYKQEIEIENSFHDSTADDVTAPCVDLETSYNKMGMRITLC